MAPLVNRLTWGITLAEYRRAEQLGANKYIEEQLSPRHAPALPEPLTDVLKQFSIASESDFDAFRNARELVRGAKDDVDKRLARGAAGRIFKQRAAETAERATWYALYSSNQLQDQMAWFWLNHFSVYANKGSIGAVLSEFDNRVIRQHAMGKFGDLLKATVRSPAMLMYLDNHQNRAGKVNENYARELMELHTLGVDGGYQQKDVQELARILTGLEVTYSDKPPSKKTPRRSEVTQNGAFRFNPQYHDYDPKEFLGTAFPGEGLKEIDKAVELLARHPATALHISRKLAQYFASDTPSDALVQQLAATFTKTDGDIRETLRTLFKSEEFADSLNDGKFKDPVHYAYSSARLAFGDMPPILRPQQLNDWIARMGQRIYGRITPDGYSLTRSDWAASGQMTTRFNLARQIAMRPDVFYNERGKSNNMKTPPLPDLTEVYKQVGLYNKLSPATRRAIEGARSRKEANLLLLASPEFMLR